MDPGAVLQVDPLRGLGEVLQAPDVDVVVPGTGRPELLLLKGNGSRRGQWQPSGTGAPAQPDARGYLGHELETQEGGAYLFKVLANLQFLMKKSIRCHDHDTVTGTCGAEEPA